MNLDPFKSYPDSAPLWIYAFEKPLGEDGRRVTEEVLSCGREQKYK